MLGTYGEPLVSEPVEAWRYGPVIPELYRRYKSFGGDPINTVPVDRTDMLNDRQEGLVRAVLKAYWNFSPWQLSSITHKPGTPWDKVYNGDGGVSAIIPNDLIEKYYRELAQS